MKRQKSITVFTPFSGRWVCVYQYLKGLSALDTGFRKTSLVFYDNSCDDDFGEILKAYLKRHQKKYAGVEYIKDLTQPIAGRGDVKELAVARILENAKRYVKSDYLFTLEDDTICPPDAMKKLFNICEADAKVGAAQGVEAGRHDRLTIGASAMEEIYRYPEKEGTPQPEIVFKGYLPLSEKTAGVEEIGGGGFYCTLFRADTFKKTRFDERMLPMISGTDVAAGPKIRRLGYKWVLDWSIPCIHCTVSADDLRTRFVTCEPKR